MNSHEIDEDAIDLEALQAQIDISMSFAQNMVSSWVKPSHKLPKSSRDTEAELKEYMRRPPRLGVGAPIPEAHNMSRETARLKGQLVRKSNKRSREEEDNTNREKSDDEEESRAGAIKKKARVDPFGDSGGKKKNKKNKKPPEDSSSALPDLPATAETDASEQAEVLGMIIESSPSRSVAPTTPSNGKCKGKDSLPEFTAQGSLLSTRNTPVATDNSDNNEKPLDIKAAQTNSPKARQPIDISLTSTPVHHASLRRLEQASVILKQPLLNLVSPDSEDDSGEDDKETNPSDSPKRKKKRKRRKKKRHSLSAADGSPQFVTAIS